uniref:Conserved oligomeric Golgi complex subunit 7 n=1 Tax=Moniliophthora roreri TaxID=221103 RepID=A0A0W0FHF5_MONRR
MNARIAYSLNSQFGPTSECIDIASFISNAAKLRQKPISDSHDSLAEECSVDDIRSSLSDVWNDTRLSSHLLKDHDSMVNFLYGTSKSARPRKKIVQEAPLTSSTSVEELEQKLSMVKLASWKLTPEASLFIRAPKDSELNIYSEPIKAVGHDQPGEGEAIVIFSVYNKVLWRPSMVSRASQHCILTSQTLGDLFESIPCLSNELPAEELEGSRVAGYGSSTQMKASNGCAICIEGMVYGDGLEEKDYADDNLDTLEDYDDLATWINDTLSFPGKDNGQDAVESLTQLDQQITHLIASLDIACEDTSSQLERIIDDVSRGVPRLTYDLHFIKDGAVSLQGVLSAVHARSRDAIPDDMNITLEQLKRLDTIKGHMEAAREVLREAESWSTLELEVTSFLTEQNYAKAASRLSEANKSMVVFQNTPEYDPRRTLLINLQNQLEASLNPARAGIPKLL